MNKGQAESALPLSPSKRLAGLIVLLSLQLLYFPLNQALQAGIELHTPWDDLIPIWPIWTIPYLLSIAGWLVFTLLATWKMADRLYLAFVVAGVLVMLASYAIQWFFPTYVERPPLSGDGWSLDLLRLVYAHDRGYNAFPSGHTYNTVVISLFWYRWQPRHWPLCLAVALVVLLSTLFTGQHHLPDLIGGIVVAWASYRIGLWAAARLEPGHRRVPGEDDDQP
jgi:membrane-associated phospholipid phosphatase